jgi:FtsP/CotA-like multicopper oxidase with cupredoxin domain
MRLLRRAGLVLVVALAVSLVVLAGVWQRAQTSTVDEVAFERPLPIPELLTPTADETGRQVFDLRLQEGTSELVPGAQTASWGVNGPHLGPTLRASRGDRVRVQVDNRLPEATTIHWHGMHLPAAADGGPHQPIEPGGRWAPEWTIDQPAATLWYHPHPHAATEEHVYRGLAGMFLIDDPETSGSDLPDEYGVDDIPVIVQDKRIGSDGELSFSKGMISPTGRLGNTILANGIAGAFLDVDTRRVRLRLLNASGARVYAFGFDDGRAFDLVATDSGVRPERLRTDRVQLSPGERAEIVVELDPGRRVVLRSFRPDLGTDPFNGRFAGAHDTLDVLELRASRSQRPSPAVPRKLVAGDAPDPAVATRTRRFELGSQRINGRLMEMGRIDEVVEAGATEIWEVTNASGLPHNFHVHDIRFWVFERDGEPPPPAMATAKDTVLVRPGETIRFVTRFGDRADADTPYMLHCHLLEHEDRGMMGQFVVTAPQGADGS